MKRFKTLVACFEIKQHTNKSIIDVKLIRYGCVKLYIKIRTKRIENDYKYQNRKMKSAYRNINNYLQGEKFMDAKFNRT